MNVTFACPKCEAANREELEPAVAELHCSHCGHSLEIPIGSIEGNTVRRCLACPGTDLFVRKDFPQGVGVAIVTVGLLASCVAWAYSMLYLTFGILFATALVDVALYVFVPNALMCYRCGAMYRGAAEIESHGSFNLETHERYRQQGIRLAQAKRSAVGQGAIARSQESGVGKT
jgi:hypothetical protein